MNQVLYFMMLIASGAAHSDDEANKNFRIIISTFFASIGVLVLIAAVYFVVLFRMSPEQFLRWAPWCCAACVAESDLEAARQHVAAAGNQDNDRAPLLDSISPPRHNKSGTDSPAAAAANQNYDVQNEDLPVSPEILAKDVEKPIHDTTIPEILTKLPQFPLKDVEKPIGQVLETSKAEVSLLESKVEEAAIENQAAAQVNQFSASLLAPDDIKDEPKSAPSSPIIVVSSAVKSEVDGSPIAVDEDSSFTTSPFDDSRPNLDSNFGLSRSAIRSGSSYERPNEDEETDGQEEEDSDEIDESVTDDQASLLSP